MKPAVLGLLVLCAACGSKPAPTAPAKSDGVPAPGATKAGISRYAPRDDCARLPGATDFRQHLVEAVQLRDTQAFTALASPGIKLDFGGGGGVEQLKQRLGDGDALWKSLEQLFRLGCAVDPHGNIMMPWVFGQDLGAIDANAALLVLGDDVPVHTAPSNGSPIVTTITWQFVNSAKGVDRAQPFTQVALPLNTFGYIATDKLRSVLDYRVLASRSTGQWRIDALVAGD